VTLRAVLVDDEPAARDELRALLLETGAIEVAAEAGNALEALAALRRERPDVLFLDVQMPVLSGFELLAMMEDDLAPAVVFVTAHDAFALRAFEANAADYLLKPVSAARLARTVEKLRAARGPAPRPPAPLVAPLGRIPCLAGKATKLVPLAEVELVRSGPAGVFVVTAAGEYFTELTLKVLEERGGLVRCHKQHLVALDRVDEIRPGGDHDDAAALLRTRGGHEVPVSRRFLPALRERLGL
jgi:two-component system LytT family response regulator